MRELSKGQHLSGSRNQTHLDLLDLVLFGKIKKQLHLWVNKDNPWKSSFSQTKWLVKIGWIPCGRIPNPTKGASRLVDLDFLAYAQREFYPRTVGLLVTERWNSHISTNLMGLNNGQKVRINPPQQLSHTVHIRSYVTYVPVISRKSRLFSLISTMLHVTSSKQKSKKSFPRNS